MTVPDHYVEGTALDVLSSTWKAIAAVERGIRRRYPEAADRQIWDALDRLEESGTAESRPWVRPDGVHSSQWRRGLVPVTKGRN